MNERRRTLQPSNPAATKTMTPNKEPNITITLPARDEQALPPDAATAAVVPGEVRLPPVDSTEYADPRDP